MKLIVSRDIDSDKILVSPEINHGDFPFRFMVHIEYMGYHSEEVEREVGKYCVSLKVVSPTEAKKTDAYDKALESFGWTPEQVQKYGQLAEYEMLLEYGIAAHLWQGCSNNLRDLMRQCRSKLNECDTLFGFAMDRAENAVGTTGWDMVKGDVLAPLHRRKPENDSPNQSTFRKISR